MVESRAVFPEGSFFSMRCYLFVKLNQTLPEGQNLRGDTAARGPWGVTLEAGLLTGRIHPSAAWLCGCLEGIQKHKTTSAGDFATCSLRLRPVSHCPTEEAAACSFGRDNTRAKRSRKARNGHRNEEARTKLSSRRRSVNSECPMVSTGNSNAKSLSQNKTQGPGPFPSYPSLINPVTKT